MSAQPTETSTPSSGSAPLGHRERAAHGFREKMDKLSSGLSRVGVAISTTWNPNHRHDEEWEQEIDKKLMDIRESHRFTSFAPEREGNLVKWAIDGHGGWIN